MNYLIIDNAEHSCDIIQKSMTITIRALVNIVQPTFQFATKP